MTGVEILATGEGATGFEPDLLAFVLTIIFCIISGFLIGSKNKEPGFGASVGTLIGIVAGFVVAIVIGFAGIEYYPTYKVTISDEVSVNEFMNKYEILNQDGKIYTVKERVADAN